jgi:hypothetical protein
MQRHLHIGFGDGFMLGKPTYVHAPRLCAEIYAGYLATRHYPSEHTA